MVSITSGGGDKNGDVAVRTRGLEGEKSLRCSKSKRTERVVQRVSLGSRLTVQRDPNDTPILRFELFSEYLHRTAMCY